MAFSSASGYGNLPNGNFSPVIYSKQVQLAFRKSSTVEDITNNDYFGEIAQMGDSVKIIKEPEISVSSYTRGTQITAQDLDDEDFSLVIDKANYFAFKVDDIEERQSHVNFEALATSSGAYSLKKAYDYNVLKFIYDNASTSASDTGTDGSPIDGDAAVDTLADVVSSAKKVLDKSKLKFNSFEDSYDFLEKESLHYSMKMIKSDLEKLGILHDSFVSEKSIVNSNALQKAIDNNMIQDSSTIISLACAHPAKFPGVIKKSINSSPETPSKLKKIMASEEHFEVIEANLSKVQEFVKSKMRSQ